MQKVNPIISVKNLYAIYNKKQENTLIALHDFSYDFYSGKIYCIIGESGSGKSTLISAINGLVKPDYGEITINNVVLNAKKDLNKVLISKSKSSKDNEVILECAKHASRSDVNYALMLHTKQFNRVSYKNVFAKNNKHHQSHCIYKCNVNYDDIKIPSFDELKNIKKTSCLSDKKYCKKIKQYREIRKTIGMVYQFPEFQLFKTTVLNDVSFGARNIGLSNDESEEKAKSALHFVGIDYSYFNYSPFGLSGGQKRKVALAGIFAINPDVFIFDEPTAGLDPVSEQEMVNYMLSYKKQNKTIIVVTHSMDQVLSIADEILVIHQGKLVKNGKPYEIFLDPEITEKSRICLPLVIDFVKKLIKANKKYEKLLQLQPRNIEELVDNIISINRRKK